MWSPALSVARAFAGASLLASCASASAPPTRLTPPRDPRLDADAAALADAACRCADPACLDEKHDALAKLESDLGGLDALPPEIYAAHKKVDRCWREGTKDMARDVAYAASQVCACQDAKCMRQVLGEVDRVADKYRDEPIPAGVEAKVRDAQREMEVCEAEKIAAGPILVPKLEAIAREACACQSAGCANGALKRFGSVASGILFVRHEGDTEGRLRRAKEDVCTCSAKLGIAAMLPGASLDAINVSCDVGP